MKWLRDHETELLPAPEVLTSPKKEKPPVVDVVKECNDEKDESSSDLDDIQALEASMPSWLTNAHDEMVMNKEKEKREQVQEVLIHQRARLKRLREEEIAQGRPMKRARGADDEYRVSNQLHSTRDHLLPEYNSDDEEDDDAAGGKKDDLDEFLAAVEKQEKKSTNRGKGLMLAGGGRCGGGSNFGEEWKNNWKKKQN